MSTRAQSISEGDGAVVLIADGEPAIVDGQASRLEGHYRVRRAYGCRVAMLTGAEPLYDIAEMGFDDYLQKPVDEGELFDCVERLPARRDYDTGLQEFYSVARRIAPLETEHDDTTLADTTPTSTCWSGATPCGTVWTGPWGTCRSRGDTPSPSTRSFPNLGTAAANTVPTGAERHPTGPYPQFVDIQLSFTCVTSAASSTT